MGGIPTNYHGEVTSTLTVPLHEFILGCQLIDKAWESFHDVKIRDRSLIWLCPLLNGLDDDIYFISISFIVLICCRYWENGKVKLTYRPVHMNTLDAEVESFPPKARVY
ncbi:hypothetical protein GW17_00019084 [Ensete ventricosum]|nr:hypothetical protein GW17_00019084 [Ensete ventricosum]